MTSFEICVQLHKFMCCSAICAARKDPGDGRSCDHEFFRRAAYYQTFIAGSLPQSSKRGTLLVSQALRRGKLAYQSRSAWLTGRS